MRVKKKDDGSVDWQGGLKCLIIPAHLIDDFYNISFELWLTVNLINKSGNPRW